MPAACLNCSWTDTARKKWKPKKVIDILWQFMTDVTFCSVNITKPDTNNGIYSTLEDVRPHKGYKDWCFVRNFSTPCYEQRRWRVLSFYLSIQEVEREISFRTESGLYYSYYKQVVQAPSLSQGLSSQRVQFHYVFQTKHFCKGKKTNNNSIYYKEGTAETLNFPFFFFFKIWSSLYTQHSLLPNK